MKRIAAACRSRSCCASTSRPSPRCAICLGGADARIVREDGATSEWRVEAGDGVRRGLPDGRSVAERAIALPALPIGRHRLIVDGVECALTVAPPEAYRPEAALRKRFGVAAQIYALSAPTGRRRSGDRRLLDPGARGREGRRRRGGLFRRQPAAHAVPARPRSGEPLLPVRPPLPRSDPHRRARRRRPAARRGGRRRARRPRRPRSRPRPSTRNSSSTRPSGAAKRAALEAWSAAFARARAARPGDPLVADYHAFVEIGRRSLAALRRLPGDRRRGGRRELAAMASGSARRRTQGDRRRDLERRRQAFEFALFCQWLADRQLGRAADARAPKRPRNRLLSRSRGRRGAGRRGSLGARARYSPSGVTIGAPPDPFSAQGQNWDLPAPNPLAGAREGWTLAQRALPPPTCATPGCCASTTRWDCSACSSSPTGAKPAEGAYLSYPLDDLIGHIALESQRARCMVIGEDLGTVPEGFRDRHDARQHPGHAGALVRARRRSSAAAGFYPPLSVACVATHDLATLAGWWRGADIAERLSLGLLTLARAGEEIARAARGEARPHRRPCRRRPDRLGPQRRCAARRRHRRRRPRARRRRRLDPRPRPVRRSRRRDGPDQPARNRPRAAQLAPQGRPGRRRRLRGQSRAGDPRGAGQGADVRAGCSQGRSGRRSVAGRR